MNITKFGHSCLLIEEQQARILIDPGVYSSLQNDVTNLDAILITHEHADHCDLASLKIILANNPQAHIFTNTGVGEKLKAEHIPFELLLGGQSQTIKGVLIEGYGEWHATIYKAIPIIHNVGYRIAERFFYGGDALTPPNVPVEILAYPALAPWMKSAEGIEYALAAKPKVCFPVHDSFLKFPGSFYALPEKMLAEQGITWQVIEPGSSFDF